MHHIYGAIIEIGSLRAQGWYIGLKVVGCLDSVIYRTKKL